MKILTVSQQFTLNSVRGTVKHQYSLLKGLTKKGHRCIVYTTATVADDLDEEIDGITVKRYNPLFSHGHYIVTPHMLKDIIREQADIIYVGSYRNFQTDVGSLASKLKRVPLVLTTHGSLILYRTLSKSWIKAFPYWIYDLLTFKFSIRFATRIVVTSEQEAAEALELGIPMHKITLIPHGIEIPHETLIESKRTSKRKILLFVGRLTPQRNLEFLLQAFKLIIEKEPKVRLIIVGEELPSHYVKSELGYKIRLVRLCEEMGILDNIIFTGWINDDELCKAYGSCDVFVYTSLYDNFGYALAEAASFGKPIISTRVGIAPDLIGSDEGGILVEHNDIIGLKDAVLKILSDDDLYRSMEETIIKRVRKYSLDAMVEQYEKLFEELTNSR